MNVPKEGSPVQPTVSQRQLVEAQLVRNGAVPFRLAAEFLKFTPRWVQYLCASGHLQKAFLLGRRHSVGITIDSFLAFVEKEGKILDEKRTERNDPSPEINTIQPS